MLVSEISTQVSFVWMLTTLASLCSGISKDRAGRTRVCPTFISPAFLHAHVIDIEKDQYNLIKQSITLLKQSVVKLCPPKYFYEEIKLLNGHPWGRWYKQMRWFVELNIKAYTYVTWYAKTRHNDKFLDTQIFSSVGSLYLKPCSV